MRVALTLLSLCVLAAPAFADESATITASIRTTSFNQTITADSSGRCWIGRTPVDCDTQMELDAAPVRIAYYVSPPTVQQKPLPPISVAKLASE